MYINMSIIVCNMDVSLMSEDMMIRVPRELKRRFNNLEKKGSWKGFAAFVREAIRIHLDRHEEIERANG